MEVIKIQKEDKLLERIQESLEPEIYPEIQKKRPKILPKIVPSTNKKVNRDLVKKVGVINNSLISFDNIILKKEPKLEKNDLIVKHCKSDIYNIIIHMSDIHIEPNNRIEEYSYVLDDTVTKVAQFCKKYEKILIVITGDILDKKETIKSQGLMLCRKFFQHLAQLGTVVIIAGNHDINEKNIQSYSEEISIKNKNINISRCDDPLTVVSDNLPIFYLQFTGLYEFGDIIFCVSSLCDRKFIKYENIPNIRKDKKYVSLYHGIVSGAIDDNNNLIISSNLSSSRYKNLTDFKNFDAVLLGDIHRTQFLDDNRTIAYAGSLVQRNHGEKLEGHGFLIWDCKTLKSPEQCLINNKWGFVDVIIKDKVWINKKDIDMLEFPYIRVCLDNCGQDNIEIRQILEEIQKDKQVQRIIYKPERKMIRKVIETTDKLYNNSNDQHNDLKELLKHNLIQSKTSNDMTKIILELHDEYYKTIKNKVEFTHNNTLWRPLRIEFKKIFIYGGDKANYIDFTNTGIYSITAENANGKSSIKNAILFALFNKIDNHGFTDVLNNKSDEGYVKLEFQYGPNIFLIHRKIIRTTNSGVKSVVDFFQLLPSKKCLNGDSETHTSDLIKDMIGSYDKFIQYNILVNDLPKCDLIKSYTKSNWITCFRKVFNLDITDEYYKVNKLRETELSDEISRLTCNLNQLKFSFKRGNSDNLDIKEKMSEISNEINNLKSLKQEVLDRLDILMADKDGIYEEKIILEKKRPIIETVDIDGLEEQLLEFKEALPNYDKIVVDDLKTLLNTLHILESEHKVRKNNVVNCNDDHLLKLKNKLHKYNKPKNSQKELQDTIYEIKLKIYSINDKIKEYSYVNFKTRDNRFEKILDLDNFYNQVMDKKNTEQKNANEIIMNKLSIINEIITNMVKMDEFYILSEDSRLIVLEELKKLENITSDTKNESSSLLDDIILEKKYRDYISRKKELSILEKTLKNTEKLLEWYNLSTEIENINQIQNIDNKISDVNQQIQTRKTIDKIDEINSILYKWNVSQKSIEENEDITLRISELDEKLKSINHTITTLNSNLTQISNALQNLQRDKYEYERLLKDLNDIENLKKKIIQLENEKKPVELYQNLMVKHNIPMQLLKDKLRIVEQSVNEILFSYTKYKILIDLNLRTRKEKKTNIDDTYSISLRTCGRDNGELCIARLSGYESTVVNLAIKKALNNLSYISKSTFFCIDEKTDCFDQLNFSEKLPEIIKLLQDHYEIILMVSQRDISNLSDYVIKIDHKQLENISNLT